MPEITEYKEKINNCNISVYDHTDIKVIKFQCQEFEAPIYFKKENIGELLKTLKKLSKQL